MRNHHFAGMTSGLSETSSISSSVHLANGEKTFSSDVTPPIRPPPSYLDFTDSAQKTSINHCSGLDCNVLTASPTRTSPSVQLSPDLLQNSLPSSFRKESPSGRKIPVKYQRSDSPMDCKSSIRSGSRCSRFGLLARQLRSSSQQTTEQTVEMHGQKNSISSIMGHAASPVNEHGFFPETGWNEEEGQDHKNACVTKFTNNNEYQQHSKDDWPSLTSLNIIGWAKVERSYRGHDNRELSILEGDIVSIYRKENSQWWFGEVNGERGLFPVTHVEEF
ncbi:unnamed protein product [Protopolystoma xenopodis]|uniref:SH3 domain-containing protein n=1 Tax=Protopolystoma xenopodis TaxID=117903 RepID=A0A3S4ZPG8_9PLAT|nr:unnamed protein product [Protopolystoma xenopodis]